MLLYLTQTSLATKALTNQVKRPTSSLLEALYTTSKIRVFRVVACSEDITVSGDGVFQQARRAGHCIDEGMTNRLLRHGAHL